ncbi:FtsK/SpoIIIE domain-containing protein [Streptomyces sp. NPDC001205]
MPKKQDEDVWGQSAGAIGALVIVLGCLMVIKDKLSLSWPTTVLLVFGVLVGLGYAAWWLKTHVPRWWAHAPDEGAPAALAQDAPAAMDGEMVAIEAAPAVHTELTSALVKAKAIEKDESILADDVETQKLPVGTRYNFLLPKSRTYDDVAKTMKSLASQLDVTSLHLKLERSRQSERRVGLLVLDDPPFTNAFPMPTRQVVRTFAGIPLGHDVTGELAGVPGFEKASMLVAGMTQTGKTTLVNGLVTCLLIAYGPDIDFYLLDGKFSGLVRFEKIAVRYESSNDPAVYESLLDELNAKSDDRHRQLESARRDGRPDPKFRQAIFIIDEASDFYATDGTKASKDRLTRITTKSVSLVRKSLESSVSVIMTTQRPSNRAIPVEVRDQFQYRVCLYVASEGGAKVVLGDSYFGTVAPIRPYLMDPDIEGQCVLYARGRSTLVRGFKFPDEDVRAIVGEVATQRNDEFVAMPETPLKRAIGLMQAQKAEFMATAELAPALGITETRPAMCGKQLSKLLGVAPGKDSEGTRGYWLADLTAAGMSG